MLHSLGSRERGVNYTNQRNTDYFSHIRDSIFTALNYRKVHQGLFSLWKSMFEEISAPQLCIVRQAHRQILGGKHDMYVILFFGQIPCQPHLTKQQQSTLIYLLGKIEKNVTKKFSPLSQLSETTTRFFSIVILTYYN